MDKPQWSIESNTLEFYLNMVDTSIQRFPNLKAGQGQLGTAKWTLLILSS